MSKTKQVLFTFIGALLLLAIFSGKKSEDKPTKVVELTREQRIKKQFSSWDGAHRNLERVIKYNMKDPDSYDHVSTRYVEDGDYLIVTTQFRGKNSFGGLVLQTVKAKVSMHGAIIKIY